VFYVIRLNARWCDIILLNMHIPTWDKSDDTKDSYLQELECVFEQFPKYSMNILVGDFNAKVGR